MQATTRLEKLLIYFFFKENSCSFTARNMFRAKSLNILLLVLIVGQTKKFKLYKKMQTSMNSNGVN
jgi:hypothetical protein